MNPPLAKRTIAPPRLRFRSRRAWKRIVQWQAWLVVFLLQSPIPLCHSHVDGAEPCDALIASQRQMGSVDDAYSLDLVRHMRTYHADLRVSDGESLGWHVHWIWCAPSYVDTPVDLTADLHGSSLQDRFGLDTRLELPFQYAASLHASIDESPDAARHRRSHFHPRFYDVSASSRSLLDRFQVAIC